MEAKETTIDDLLAYGSTKNFYEVPPYQRPYRWDPDDAVKLVQDVQESCESEEDEYFIGSMVCIKPKGKNRFEVVDGQQRLITLTIVMKVISEIIDDNDLKVEFKRRVLHGDSFNKNEQPEPIVEVHPEEKKFYLQRILQGKSVDAKTDKEKVFNANYESIKKHMEELGQSTVQKIAEHLVKKVFVVRVIADNQASSFRLFNVLNTRGTPLSDADLLKNLLFQKARDGEAERIKDQWQEIEESVVDTHLVRADKIFFFLRLHIASQKTNRDRATKISDETGKLVKASVFEYFEHRLQKEFGNDSLKLLDELCHSAKNYETILKGDLGCIEILATLNEFDAREWLPALMAYQNKGHDQANFLAFATLLEKVYVQSMLIRNSSPDEACYYAVESINEGNSTTKTMEVLYSRVRNKQFEEALDSEEFYDGSRPKVGKLVRQILLRVDEARYETGVRERGQQYNAKKISIEHILPQTATDRYWQEKFTDSQRTEWMHKLGNLTLLSGRMNATARNAAFPKKKEVYLAKNKQTPFQITRELCDLEDWDMEALRARHETLKAEIKNLWRVSSQ